MMHGFVDIDKDNFLTINENATREHSFKVNHQSARLNSKKYFFTSQAIGRGIVTDGHGIMYT